MASKARNSRSFRTGEEKEIARLYQIELRRSRIVLVIGIISSIAGSVIAATSILTAVDLDLPSLMGRLEHEGTLIALGAGALGGLVGFSSLRRKMREIAESLLGTDKEGR